MNKKRFYSIVSTLAAVLLTLGMLPTAAVGDQDPLPSWNEGTAKQSIIDFVSRVTRSGSPDFVVPEQRIATFDNDGTLWSEQPMYFQLFFAIDRVKALAPQNPAWKTQQPFKAVLHHFQGDTSTFFF